MADGDGKIIGTAATGTVETTDATQTTLCSYRVNNNKSTFLMGHYLAQDIDTGSIMVGMVIAVANSVGGSCNIRDESAVANWTVDADALEFDVIFDASGLDARLRVTGNSDTVRWYGLIEIVEVEVTV